jgi:hypothetical protein
MRFEAKRYEAPGFGNVFTMNTRAVGGLMRLMTAVFTPNLGGNVPLLLVDVMAFGKKRAVFAEYYDCTASGAPAEKLRGVWKQYCGLPDYPEKPAWYVGERAPYSLIKGGGDEAALAAMLSETVRAYAAECSGPAAAQRSEANRAGLGAFLGRMAKEGNPSSAAMEKALGKEGAERFFRTAVMPAEYQSIPDQIQQGGSAT